MAGLTQSMKGARLEYVVRPVKGVKTRQRWAMNPTSKKNEPTDYEVKDSFMVYLPSGQSYCLTKDELVRRGFARQPKLMNIDQVNDTESAAGRYKHAIELEEKRKAWTDLEDEVIKSCTRKHGPVEGKVKRNDRTAA